MGAVMLVAIGGACGSVARYLVTLMLQSGAPGSYPLATLTVNLVGCFAFGFLTGRIPPGSEPVRLILLVGFLGGFTTFSAFGGELATGLRSAALSQVALHLCLHIVGGVAMVMAGFFVQERLG